MQSFLDKVTIYLNIFSPLVKYCIWRNM